LLVNAALDTLPSTFDQLYANTGWVLIAPEKLVRGL
jgi:hypothetical protein